MGFLVRIAPVYLRLLLILTSCFLFVMSFQVIFLPECNSTLFVGSLGETLPTPLAAFCSFCANLRPQASPVSFTASPFCSGSSASGESLSRRTFMSP